MLQMTQSRKFKKSTDWEKIFVSHISDKETIRRIYKEPLQLNNKKTNPKKN